jgi:succinoglycan biosynthesis transport protein ExoP
MSTQSPAAFDQAIDVRYYLDLLWRNRVAILLTAAVVLVLGLLVAFLQAPEYRASAMLQIEPPPPLFLSVTDALVGGGNYWQNADFYNTQFKVLRSHGLGEKVVKRLKLEERDPFKDALDKGGVFMAHVTVEPLPETRLVYIQVTHRDPKEASLWANTLADIYTEESLSSRVESARRAYEWLQERLASTQRSMRETQEKLIQSYRGQDFVLTPEQGGQSSFTTTLNNLNQDLVDAQTRRIELEAVLNQAAQLKPQPDGLETLPQVVADSLSAGLATQLAGMTTDMTRLRERFREAHPDVVRLQAQIDQLRQARRARAEQIVRSLESELGSVRKKESDIRAAIDEQKTQAAGQSRRASETEALRKEVESSKNLYEVLLQKMNETDIAASLKSQTVTIIERASTPTSPVRPDKKRYALISLALGLLAGVALVLGRDLLENTLKDPDEVERYLHLDLLAAVPEQTEANASLVTEAYQNLRTALIFGRRDDGGQVVLVTGTAPQEGKTTTIVNIAKLLAGSGERTIVIDFDLRRGQLHNRLGMEREPGITDHFANHVPVEALLRSTSEPNLMAITAGPLPPNPPAILARRNLDVMLKELRQGYDWILLDSPPLASVTDALLLARHADLAVFVVEHNKIDKKLIRRSVTALQKTGVNILGAVLNAVNVKSKSYYYYYYRPDYTQQSSASPLEGQEKSRS